VVGAPWGFNPWPSCSGRAPSSTWSPWGPVGGGVADSRPCAVCGYPRKPSSRRMSMVLLQYQDRHIGSRCPEDAKIFPTPPTNPSARARGHLPVLDSTSPPRQEVPPDQSAGREASHVPGGAPGREMAQDLLRTSVSKPPFGMTPDSQRRGREEHHCRPAKAQRLGILSAPGPRGPGGPLGMSGSKRRLTQRPGGRHLAQNQGASLSRGPTCDQVLAVPQDRTPGRPSPRCRKPVNRPATPPGIRKPALSHRAKLGSPARKGAPLSGFAGKERPRGKALRWTQPRETWGRPTWSGDARLWRSCSWPCSHRAQGGPGIGPGVGWPAPASSSLPPRGGDQDPAHRRERSSLTSCTVLRFASRRAQAVASRVLRDGDSPVKRAPSPGSCRPAPGS